MAGVLVEFGGGETGDGLGGVVRIEVEDDDGLEIGEDDELRDLAVAFRAGEGLDIVERLGLGPGQVLAAGLVLAEHDAGVEDIDAAVVAFEVADLLLEGGDGAALDAVDAEKVGPEGLCLGPLVGGVLPLLGEADGVGTDFALGQTHGFPRGGAAGSIQTRTGPVQSEPGDVRDMAHRGVHPPGSLTWGCQCGGGAARPLGRYARSAPRGEGGTRRSTRTGGCWGG